MNHDEEAGCDHEETACEYCHHRLYIGQSPKPRAQPYKGSGGKYPAQQCPEAQEKGIGIDQPGQGTEAAIEDRRAIPLGDVYARPEEPVEAPFDGYHSLRREIYDIEWPNDIKRQIRGNDG